MKILVCGDVHIGGSYALGKTDPNTQLNSRLLDFSDTFNTIIDNAVKENAKVVVLTGDVFEHRVPTSSQINTFSKCIIRAVKSGLKVIIVVGNHDQQRNVDTSTIDFLNHLEIPNVCVYQDLGVKTLQDEYGKDYHIILMPYRDRRMLNTATNSEAIEIIKTQLSDLIKGLTGTKIVVGHFMLEKTIEDDNPDSFSINELVIPFNTFDEVDIALMGHIHKHEIMNKEKPVIIYTGSMDKVSFSEKEHQKVSIILDTNDIEKYQVVKTKTRNMYELNFDYSSNDKLYKEKINDKIIEDINAFDTKKSIADAIVKLIVKLKEADLYHVNHNKIKEHLLSKKTNNILPLQITSTSFRQLRNSNITEDTDEKKAMKTFIDSLSEPDGIKKRLQKYADQIIEDQKG